MYVLKTLVVPWNPSQQDQHHIIDSAVLALPQRNNKMQKTEFEMFIYHGIFIIIFDKIS